MESVFQVLEFSGGVLGSFKYRVIPSGWDSVTFKDRVLPSGTYQWIVPLVRIRLYHGGARL